MDSIPLGMTLDDTRVRISPLVPSIILDYNMRNWRKEEVKERSNMDHTEYTKKHNEYTIGVLLGVEIEANIIVTNAFGLKWEETSTPFNKEYNDFMVKHLTKGTKEGIVGMFHVSKKGQDINDFEVMRAFATIREEQQNTKSKCILLSLDGTLEKPTLNMKTYFSLSYSLGETAENLCIFVDTPHEVIVDRVFWQEANTSESITKNKFQDYDKTHKLFESGEKLKLNISNIAALLDIAREYVDGVQAGKLEGDTKIDRALNSALSKIAHVTPDSIEVLLKDHYQDLLYISKLTSLIQDQLLISKKLNKEI